MHSKKHVKKVIYLEVTKPADAAAASTDPMVHIVQIWYICMYNNCYTIQQGIVYHI